MENWTSSDIPVSKPAGLLPLAARGVHGSSNDDCVTECWRPALGKKNVTIVPFGAVKLFGLKTKFPLGATLTLTVPGAFVAGALTAAIGDVVVGPGAGPPYIPCGDAKAEESRRASVVTKSMMIVKLCSARNWEGNV